MDSIEFILIIVVFTVILIWYLQNAEGASDGLIGLLALKDDPEVAKHGRRKSYRIKDRKTVKPAPLKIAGEPQSPSAYKTAEEAEHMRRRFRAQDEARYRVKDKAAGFKSKTPQRSADE